MNNRRRHDQIIGLAITKIRESMDDILAVYVFGSFGTEYQTKESDLDLAIISGKGVDSVSLWHLAQSIASDINLNVEIVDLQRASTVFRYQVITTGKRVYCCDEPKCDALENVYASMYLRLNEERKGIIQDKRIGNG